VLNTRHRLATVAATLGAAGVLLTAAPLAFAADSTVTQQVTGGSLAASVANVTLGSVATAHTVQNNAGTLALTADDSTGSGAGWNVTIQSSAFDYTGDNGGTDIPAGNFSLTSAAAPARTTGQAVDGTGGPKVPTDPSPLGALDTARKTVQANAGFGSGTYTQNLGVNLAIPTDSRVGTYTAMLTTTISSGP
jgi:hypothetical protein